MPVEEEQLRKRSGPVEEEMFKEEETVGRRTMKRKNWKVRTAEEEVKPEEGWTARGRNQKEAWKF